MKNDTLFIIFINAASHNKRYILINFLAIFFIVACLSFLIPKRYTSTLSIFPNQNENAQSSLSMLAQGFGLSGGGNFSYPISNISSSNIILNNIYDSTFTTVDGKQKSLKDLLYKPSRILQIKENEDLIRLKTLEKFKKRLSISYDRINNITSIKVELEDPLVAKEVLDLFYNELSKYINESVNNAGSYKRIFIDERIEVLETELAFSEKNLQNFLTENKNINDSPLLLNRYNELVREITLIEGAYIILKQELESAKIDEIKNNLSLFILEKPEVSPEKSYPPRLYITLISSLLLTFISLIYRMREKEFLIN